MIKNEDSCAVLVPLLSTVKMFEHVVVVDFEQANVCRVHIKKLNTFGDKFGYILRYCCSTLKFINK